MRGAAGRRILLVGPQVFGYERAIGEQLSSGGAVVTYLNDRPWDAVWLKGLLRLFPRLLWHWADRHYRDWIAAEAPAAIDIVLVLKGEALSPRTLRRLRAHYPAARFVYYLWDSIANTRGATSRFETFDALYSQDPEDCRKHSALRYRPLFFLPVYQDARNQRSLSKACYFLGTLNGDRPQVLARISNALKPGYSLDYWLYVRSGLELQLRWLVDHALRRLDPRRLLRRPMNSREIARHYAQAAAVIDIEHYRQTGLTMRTFEALAAGCKLITTNPHIAREAFYDPQRILIIDRTRPVIPAQFLASDAAPLGEEFLQKYSLAAWLEELLG
jgi:hypothetical protein